MKIHIIGDQGSRKYDEGLVNKVNEQIEAEERRKRLEDRRARLQTESQPVKKTKSEEAKPKTGVLNQTGFNLSDYLILEGNTHGSYSYPDLLVARERSKEGKNWTDTQTELRTENSYMLTIRQFVDLLSMLKSDKVYDGTGTQLKSEEVTTLLNEIREVRAPYRSEHLDAKFNKQVTQTQITYHKIKSDGSIEEVTENLEECVMIDTRIDLNSWLANSTTQGLPKRLKGDLYYHSPRHGAVARFIANTYGAGLNCYRSPINANASLGVRIVRKKL